MEGMAEKEEKGLRAPPENRAQLVCQFSFTNIPTGLMLFPLSSIYT